MARTNMSSFSEHGDLNKTLSTAATWFATVSHLTLAKSQQLKPLWS